MSHDPSSYWQVFRLYFTLFFLEITGSLFYSWDGFKYYGSFSDFILGVAVILMLWTVGVIVLTLLIWLSMKVISQAYIRLGREFKAEKILLFVLVFILLTILDWEGETYLWRYIDDTRRAENIIFIAVAFVSIALTVLVRNRAVSWIRIVQERITPLVWLFMALVIFSVPLDLYQAVAHNMPEGTHNESPPEVSRPPITKNDRPDIILVTFDALTARNMSAYGYHRETTPFIDEWAKSASLFTRAEAESNYTTPTTASIMTGKRIWSHQLYHPHGYNIVNADTENLPVLLKKNGYYNIALIQNDFASVQTLGISGSFDIAPLTRGFKKEVTLETILESRLFLLFGARYHLYNWIIHRDSIFVKFLHKLPPDISTTEFPPDKIFNALLKIIDSGPPEPFFAWVHIYPPHVPYLPPEPYMAMYDNSPKYRTLTNQRHIWQLTDIETKRSRYDEFIRYCDKEFEIFLKDLSKRKKKTVLILSSDHGESFDHDYITHGGPHLYEELTHIPLIIKEPGQKEGRKIDDVVEQIDITPTILELAHIQMPGWMEGRSLVPLLRDKELPPEKALSMVLESTPRRHRIKEGTFAVWDGDFKLIHYLKDNKSMLFNLKEDPGELNNLYDREPEISEHLLAYIKTSLKKVNEKMGKNN